MRGNLCSNVGFFRQANWDGTTCYLTGPKKKRKWRKSFVVFMFIVNNSIFKSIMS